MLSRLPVNIILVIYFFLFLCLFFLNSFLTEKIFMLMGVDNGLESTLVGVYVCVLIREGMRLKLCQMKEREDCIDIVLCVHSLYDFDTPTLKWECKCIE